MKIKKFKINKINKIIIIAIIIINKHIYYTQQFMVFEKYKYIDIRIDNVINR